MNVRQDYRKSKFEGKSIYPLSDITRHSVPLPSTSKLTMITAMYLKGGVLRSTFFIGAGLLATSITAFGDHRLISLGDRRLSIDCDGEVSSATVVLIAGGGRTAKDWVKVQPAVS